MGQKQLGPITAYNYAVAGGYTGTEAEFQAMVAGMTETAEDFSNFNVDVIVSTPETTPEADYDSGHLIFTLPRGEKGETGSRGEKGEKGDTGDAFHIVKTYASISAMNADYSSSDVNIGEFVMIVSDVEDPDNAKCYVKGDKAFVFVVDMSGSTGIQGPKGDTGDTGAVPQFSIGTVTKGENPSASIGGTATNPTLSLVLPKGDKGDKGEKGEKGEKGDPGDVDQQMSDTSGLPVANKIVKAYIDSGLAGKMDDVTLADVAMSGLYSDLIGIPALKPVATSGSYNDLTDKPDLKPIATSGSYEDLSDTPDLAPVATSGAYNDLTGKPNLFSGRYEDLTGKPELFSGDYSDLANKPDLKSVATSGSYDDLSDKPDLKPIATSGSYEDLSNKPNIPGLIIASDVVSSAWYADTTYEAYPFRATLAINNITADYVPFIFFDGSDTDLDKLASWAVSDSGSVYIYCSENIGQVTIPTVMGIKQ